MDSLVEAAREAASTSAAHGALRVQDILEAATTPTGERRVAAGGVSAGRHRSGNMVSSISYSDISEGIREGSAEWFSFGWFSEYVEAYFREQDLGINGPPPAGALHGAFIEAREMYIGLLGDILKARR